MFGGKNSKLKLVNYNCDYCFMTVVDEATGRIANLHYVKNSEVTNLPVQNNVATNG